MNPTPSPSPVDVFVHSGPAEWWQIVAALGPLAVLLGAMIAGIIGWRTLRQKAVADNRAEWWKRTQWALDSIYSGDKKRGTVGLKVLKVLGESELAGPGELAVLEAAWEKPLIEAEKKLKLTVVRDHAPVSGTNLVIEPAAEIGTESPSKGSDGILEVKLSSPARPGGVDGEPGPRDNGEDDRSGTPEGGAQ